MSFQQEETPQALARSGGQKRFQQPLYTGRAPKLQVGKDTTEITQLGAVPRLCGSAHMEFALTKRGGRTRFRFTEVDQNGQRHRFHLDKSELLAAVSAIHKCRSIMGAAA